MAKKQKKKKEDKRGGVNHLSEKQLKERRDKYSEAARKEHKKIEGLYRTLLEEVPEIREKYMEEGVSGYKEKEGADKSISKLTRELPQLEGKSERTVKRIRQQGSQINLSREDKTREKVKLIRKTAEKLPEELNKKEVSMEVKKKLKEKGVNISESTVRQYLGKKGDKKLQETKKEKEKKEYPSQDQLKKIKKNLKLLEEAGVVDKTAYNQRTLSQLPKQEIEKLKEITERAVEEEKPKIEKYRKKEEEKKKEKEEIGELYKGERKRRREELNELGYELSSIEQVLPLCKGKEKDKLIEKAKENPSKSLFEIKKEVKK